MLDLDNESGWEVSMLTNLAKFNNIIKEFFKACLIFFMFNKKMPLFFFKKKKLGRRCLVIFLFVVSSGLNQFNFVYCKSTLEKLKNITEILNPYP